MKVKNDEKFIKIVERLVDPGEVSDLYFFQRFRKFLPNSIFKKLLIQTSRKSPYMGFIIDPYSLFLFFKLKDFDRAKAMLPDRYELVKTKIFDDEEPDYYHGMGIFNTRASTFWGTRHESYLIARDKETGLISWIFIDIISDTLIALPKEGVTDRNTKRAIYTTNSKGEIFMDIGQDGTDRHIKLKGKITNGKKRPIDQPLWISGNNSVAHSKDLMDKNDDPFAVIFDPAEVETALDIPVEDVDLQFNNLFPGLAEEELCKVLCFPYTQHYIADSPGCRTYIKNTQDMVEAYDRISEMKEIKTFSTKGIKRMFFGGMILSNLAWMVLLALRLWG